MWITPCAPPNPPGKSLFAKSFKVVEERQTGLVAYLQQLFSLVANIGEDSTVDTFLGLSGRVIALIATQVCRHLCMRGCGCVKVYAWVCMVVVHAWVCRYLCMCGYVAICACVGVNGHVCMHGCVCVCCHVVEPRNNQMECCS